MTGPNDGELVVFCQHADVGDDHIDISKEACPDQPFHWYQMEGDLNITRKDPVTNKVKERLTIKWMAVCNRCYEADKGKDLNGKLSGRHARWIGEPPNITPQII